MLGLPPHPLWLAGRRLWSRRPRHGLLRWCGSGALLRLRPGREVLDVTSTGLPHHKFDVSFEPGVPIAFSTTLPLPEDYVQRGVAFGGRPLPDGPIGVAVNGVAIYAYNTNLTKRDGCFGHKIDGAYVYVEAFPCLYGDDRNEYHTVQGSGVHWLWHVRAAGRHRSRGSAVEALPQRCHWGDERRLSAVWASG